MTKLLSNNLKYSYLTTPLGEMTAIADDDALYFLEFNDHEKLEEKIKRLINKTASSINRGHTKTLSLIQDELDAYFNGQLRDFSVKLFCVGSDFQQKVWQALQKIPYGHTHSYAELAKNIGRIGAYRAVARANSTNRLPIVIPCHRVINANGELGGYSSGLARKEWLLKHEKNR